VILERGYTVAPPPGIRPHVNKPPVYSTGGLTAVNF
jgi:hypothetical protein